MRIPSFTLLSLSCCALAAAAQVPPGTAIHGAIGGSATPLIIVDRTPSVTVVTGFSALPDINAIKLDPIDSSIWAGNVGSGNIVRMTLTGTVVTSQPIFATHPGGSGTSSIAFDQDCNILVAGGTPTTNGGVWRIDRTTAAVTQIVGPASGLSTIVNAMDADPFTGDIYIGLFGGSGGIYKLSPPAYTPVLFATPSTVNISGITMARRPGGNLLFASQFAGVGNASLVAVDLLGAATTVPGTPGWPDLNWVAYDQQRDDLWVIGTGGTRVILSSTVSGANTLLHTLPGGVPASLDVNDSVDGTLVVCPTFVPTQLAPITIEHGLSGKPGHIGVIAMIQPFFLLLAAGPIDAGGRITSKIPNVGIPSGNPGRFQFLAATIDPATLIPRISNQVAWPGN